MGHRNSIPIRAACDFLSPFRRPNGPRKQEESSDRKRFGNSISLERGSRAYREFSLTRQPESLKRSLCSLTSSCTYVCTYVRTYALNLSMPSVFMASNGKRERKRLPMAVPTVAVNGANRGSKLKETSAVLRRIDNQRNFVFIIKIRRSNSRSFPRY